MPEYEFDVRMMVTADDENDAYSQVSDSGLSSGALIGTIMVLYLDLLDEVPGT